MTFYTNSAAETEEVGRKLAEALEKEQKKKAFIAMRGEMGVGKTAFTRGFASHLGIGTVKSPTYTIVNEYKGRSSVFHFDTYRIEDEDDLYSTGYDDYISRDGFVVCEWSERIEDLIPEDSVFVTISRTDGGDGRMIEIINAPEVI